MRTSAAARVSCAGSDVGDQAGGPRNEAASNVYGKVAHTRRPSTGVVVDLGVSSMWECGFRAQSLGFTAEAATRMEGLGKALRPG